MKTSLRGKEITNILKRGKRIISEGVVLIYEKGEEKEYRFAILVSKKKIRKSTERNRVRRIIREILRVYPIPFTRFIILCTKEKYIYNSVRSSLEQFHKK